MKSPVSSGGEQPNRPKVLAFVRRRLDPRAEPRRAPKSQQRLPGVPQRAPADKNCDSKALGGIPA